MHRPPSNVISPSMASYKHSGLPSNVISPSTVSYKHSGPPSNVSPPSTASYKHYPKCCFNEFWLNNVQ